jgi:FkbM family methyltransferase
VAVKLALAGKLANAVEWSWSMVSSGGRSKTMRMRFQAVSLLVRTGTPDPVVAMSCFGGEFDEVIASLPTLAHHLIIDAGGYIGTAAIVFARRYPSATVVTLEPSSLNYGLLLENVKPFSNIVPLKAALAAQSGVVTLNDRGAAEWGYSLLPGADAARSREIEAGVTALTIGDILETFNANGIDILKMDIEGGELDIFRVRPHWIDGVGSICIELHDNIIEGCEEAFFRATKGRNNRKLKGEKYISTIC